MIDVSVLTPSYGYGRFIRDCLESVLRQEGVAVEHIVQDGASTDETVRILEEFDGFVRWSSEPDLGQSDALNKALDKAQGRWIAWLNADEFYLPGALELLVGRGDRNRADVVYGESVFVDESGRLERLLAQHPFRAKVLREFGCFISSSSLLIRRSVLGEAPWDAAFRRRMDWDLYMRLASEGARFLHVPHPIGAFRVHPAQVTAPEWTEFVDEDAALAKRHGLPEDPYVRWDYSKWGRRSHPIYKLLNGGYFREWRVRPLVGRDLRWFREEAGIEACRLLVERGYRRKAA